ncbi:hypothetical protein B0H14DRAFT_3462926 [Mycena olivaceomarginata]|nr:hypothetical protein B0H14DRAFT_3462926 [Mycena olivaceomarginata]
MFTSDPNTILPPCKFRTKHTLHGVSSTDANRFIIRVHLNTGHGELKSVGFVASAYAKRPWEAPDNAYHSGSREQLAELAASHITQYKDGTWREPTKFISGSYSLAYVLFEALRRQRNAWNRSGKSEILISIIDLAEVPNDKWLATELVGAYWTHAAFFARWAQEVLIYGHIPSRAVVATMSVNSFFDCLPRWCQSIREDIHSHSLKSTEDVVDQLKILAKENNMLEEEDVLLVHSIESSLATLRNPSASEDAIDRVSRFAAIFCWWPKWIMGTDPKNGKADKFANDACDEAERDLRETRVVRSGYARVV